MITIEYLRSFRVYEIAIFDVVVSYLGIYLLAPVLIKLFKKIKIKTTRKTWLWLMFPLSIVVHLLVGQQTTLVKMFLDPNSYFLIKTIIILMIVMGIKS